MPDRRTGSRDPGVIGPWHRDRPAGGPGTLAVIARDSTCLRSLLRVTIPSHRRASESTVTRPVTWRRAADKSPTLGPRLRGPGRAGDGGPARIGHGLSRFWARVKAHESSKQMTNLRAPLKRSESGAMADSESMRYETFIISARDSSHI